MLLCIIIILLLLFYYYLLLFIFLGRDAALTAPVTQPARRKKHQNHEKRISLEKEPFASTKHAFGLKSKNCALRRVFLQKCQNFRGCAKLEGPKNTIFEARVSLDRGRVKGTSGRLEGEPEAQKRVKQNIEK